MSNEINKMTGYQLIQTKLEQSGAKEVKEEDVNYFVKTLKDENNEVDAQGLYDALSTQYELQEAAELAEAVAALAAVDGKADKISLLELQTEYEVQDDNSYQDQPKKEEEAATIDIGNGQKVSQSTYDDLKNRILNQIEQKQKELSTTKENRGWLTSIGNGIAGLFGGGDKKTENEIEKLQKAYAALESNPAQMASVYQTVMGEPLSVDKIAEIKDVNELMSTFSNEGKSAVADALLAQLDALEADFDNTKEHNGWLSGLWDGIKNWTGIGASSKKTQSEINNAKELLNEAKSDPKKLAEAYKLITGKELTAEEYTKLYSGETSLFSDSKAAESVMKYQKGQTMVTDIVADAVVGIVSSVPVILGVVAAPFTGGASIALGVGASAAAGAAIGAVVKPAIKATDAWTGGREYGLNNLAYDAATGAVGGAVAGATAGVGNVANAAKTGAQVATFGGKTFAASSTVIGKIAKLPMLEVVTTGGRVSSKIGQFAVKSGTRYATGFAAGFADTATRDILEGNTENLLSDSLKGGHAAGTGAVIIGGAIDIAGAGISKIGSKLPKTAAANSIDGLSSKLDDVTAKLDSIETKVAAGEKLTTLEKYQRVILANQQTNLTNKLAAASSAANSADEVAEALSKTGDDTSKVIEADILDENGNVIGKTKVTDITDSVNNVADDAGKAADTAAAKTPQIEGKPEPLGLPENSSAATSVVDDIADDLTKNADDLGKIADDLTQPKVTTTADGAKVTEYPDGSYDIEYGGYKQSNIKDSNGDLISASDSGHTIKRGGESFEYNYSDIADDLTQPKVTTTADGAKITQYPDGSFDVEFGGQKQTYIVDSNGDTILASENGHTIVRNGESTAYNYSNFSDDLAKNADELAELATVKQYNGFKDIDFKDPVVREQFMQQIDSMGAPGSVLEMPNGDMITKLGDNSFKVVVEGQEMIFTKAADGTLVKSASNAAQAADTAAAKTPQIEGKAEPLGLPENSSAATSVVDDIADDLTKNADELSKVADDLTQPKTVQTEPLSQKDIQNLQQYKNGEFYERFNQELRGLDDIDISAKDLAIRDSLDKAFETDGITLTEDAKLYRGVRSEYSWDTGTFSSETFDNLKPGDVLTDKAFVSTSSNIDVANAPDYIGYPDGLNPNAGNHGYLLEINAPKGTTVLDVESVINGNGGKTMSLNESELLLPRNTSFVVREVNGNKIVLDIIVE